MKRFLLFAVLLVSLMVPMSAQQQVEVSGVSVTCPNGLVIENGVEMVINMRTGFSYTATAIGIGDFDPVIAVTDGSTVLCNDDSDDALNYGANLPTTGVVEANPFSASSPFSYSGDGFGDISVIVGSFDNRAGEFVLFIEGLAVTNADGFGEGAGDPFTLNLTPNVHLSEVPLSAYMIAVTSALDPLMTVVDEDDTIIRLDDGSLFACDDAGSAGLCWGETESLTGYSVARGVRSDIGGFNRDAYMSIPSELFGLGPDESGFITWRYTSFDQNTFGDYIAVFHLGTTATGMVEVEGGVQPPTENEPPAGSDADIITDTSTLTESQPEQLYRFNGNAGDTVTITMVAEDESALDTRLFLYTAEGYEAGEFLEENDDAADSNVGRLNSQIVDFELPEDGEYVIVATRFQGEGDYTLTIEGVAPPSGGGANAETATFTVEGLGITFEHSVEWTVLEAEPTFIVMLDSLATAEGLDTDAPSLEDDQFLVGISPLADYAEVQATIEETNAALIEGLGDEAETEFGESEALKLGDYAVIKTSVIADGLDSLLYLVDVDGTYIVMQASAGDLDSFDAAFDAVVSSMAKIE